MSIEELCKEIQDGGIGKVELIYRLNELRQDGYVEGFSNGYTKAADDLKRLANEHNTKF